MVLFVAATVACILSRSIETFLLCRLVQGFAGAGGVVISKSVASDLYEGPALTRFFVMLAAVQGLAPIFAPVLGGVLLEVTDWRGIFGVLAVLGVAMCCVLAGFRESLPAVRRSSDGVVATFGHYLPVVRNRPFLLCVAVQALAMGVMFTYIASSPFLFQQHYGISSLAYSMLFGVNAFAIMLGSFAVTRFRRPAAALLAGARGFLAVCLLAALALVTDAPVWCVEAALFALLFCLGLVLPTSTSLALEFERANSGSASALIGCSALLVGGIVSPLTGIGPMQTMTAALMLLRAAGTLLCARRVPRCRREARCGGGRRRALSPDDRNAKRLPTQRGSAGVSCFSGAALPCGAELTALRRCGVRPQAPPRRMPPAAPRPAAGPRVAAPRRLRTPPPARR